MRKISPVFILAIILVLSGTVSAQRKTVKKPAPKATPKTAAKSAAAVFTPGAQDADGWRPYRSSEDAFRISFPPTPVSVQETDEQGKKTGNRYYDPEPVTAARVSLTVIVSDMGAPADDPEFQRLLYKSWLQGVSETRPGAPVPKLVLEKEFALGNRFGLEVIVDRGVFRFHAKIISIKNKLYQIAVGSATPDALKPGEYEDVEKWSKKFFDSFQMTEAP